MMEASTDALDGLRLDNRRGHRTEACIYFLTDLKVNVVKLTNFSCSDNKLCHGDISIRIDWIWTHESLSNAESN